MTTPVFGSGPNGRPMGASTPTGTYYSGSQLTPSSMEMRVPMSDSMYRSNMNSGPNAWGTTSGWCMIYFFWKNILFCQIFLASRSTPGLSDFRPSFAQHPLPGTSNQSSGNGNLNAMSDQRYNAESAITETFSDEIQDEANSYFQQMFTDHDPLSVADFIQQMAKFRQSADPKVKVS